MKYKSVWQNSGEKKMNEITLESVIISLILTLIIYGAVPIVFAKCRTTPIYVKKYNRLCWGINFIFALLCRTISTHQSGAYFLWTAVFNYVGKNMLSKKELLILEEEPACSAKTLEDGLENCETTEDRISYFINKYKNESDKKLNKILANPDYTATTKQAIQQILDERLKNQIQPSIKEIIDEESATNLNDAETEKHYLERSTGDEIKFCRKCGKKLQPGGKFCNKCGTKIYLGDDKDV